MHESIQNYISKFANLTAEELSVVKTCMQLREIPRKTLLLNAGDFCNFEAYVLKGCIREYFIDHKGQELTLEFAVEDWWVSDITSFENQTPSIMYIETLEDCEILVLSRTNV
jgi:CRP-like cAMP-binding protein